MSSYLWFDYRNDTSPELLAGHLCRMLGSRKFERRLRRHPLVFLCIGTPRIPGDCLGPLVGSLLTRHNSGSPAGPTDRSAENREGCANAADYESRANAADCGSWANDQQQIMGHGARPWNGTFAVYGTMEQPVHALNLKSTLKEIRQKYPKAVMVVIDAAIGDACQNGYLAIKKGALKPGLGLGKDLPAIGHIQITGVFDDLYGQRARRQMAQYSLCIARGLTAFQNKAAASASFTKRIRV